MKPRHIDWIDRTVIEGKLYAADLMIREAMRIISGNDSAEQYHGLSDQILLTLWESTETDVPGMVDKDRVLRYANAVIRATQDALTADP